MRLLLQLLSIICVVAVLLSYNALRKTLHKINFENNSDVKLHRAVNSYTVILIVSVIIFIASIFLLKKLSL